MIFARFSAKAQRDLDNIEDFIAKDNPAAAKEVRNALLDIADLLAAHPKAGRLIQGASPRHKDVRWFVVPRFRNYLLFYRPAAESIFMLRILHAREDWTRFYH